MEKTISSNLKNIFYCVQPISIHEDTFEDLFVKKANLEKMKNVVIETNNIPSWFEKFNYINHLYRSLYILKLDKIISNEILFKDLEQDFKVNQKFSLQEYLDLELTKYYVIFDFNLKYFILIYEIHFQFLQNDFDKIVETNSQSFQQIKNHDYKVDYYNTIRNLLVKENEYTVISKWAQLIEMQTKNKIHEIFDKFYNISVKKDRIKIKNNTGNITNFAVIMNPDEKYYNKIVNQLLNVNDFAERIKSNNKPLKLEDQKIYYFNGRFHTICMFYKDEQERYFPIQFQMQYLWFYLMMINQLIEDLNDDILNYDSLKILKSQITLMDSLINKMQYLNMYNENFKRAIETDNTNIYMITQSYWNLDAFLNSINSYVSYFKDFLNRLYVKSTSKNERRQNKILFIISLIQVIALISVWSDYLTLISNNNTNYSSIVIFLFGNIKNLQKFNLFLPISFMIIIIIIQFISIRKQK